MKTLFVTPQTEAEAILRIVKHENCVSGPLPERFIRIMRTHRGTIRLKDIFGDTEDGLEYRNPLIVALGDSVTAGHFEFAGNPAEIFQGYRNGELDELAPTEITDVRECYLDKFREKLIERFEQTSVNVINAGIAGDTILGMQRRLYRDVIRPQPDLVLLNASLNWGTDCGDLGKYALVYRQVIRTVKEETRADVVLLTPNMETPSMFSNTQAPLSERVKAVRKIAAEENVSLVDVYSLWEKYSAEGYDLKALLSNGINHPSVIGHEVYALALMQLFEG